MDAGHGEIPVVHLLDRPFVLGGKAAIEELGDQGGFSDLGRTHDDDLVADVARRYGDVVVFLGVDVFTALRPENPAVIRYVIVYAVYLWKTKVRTKLISRIYIKKFCMVLFFLYFHIFNIKSL